MIEPRRVRTRLDRLHIPCILTGIRAAIPRILISTAIHIDATILAHTPFARLVVSVYVTVGLAISHGFVLVRRKWFRFIASGVATVQGIGSMGTMNC